MEKKEIAEIKEEKRRTKKNHTQKPTIYPSNTHSVTFYRFSFEYFYSLRAHAAKSLDTVYIYIYIPE